MTAGVRIRHAVPEDAPVAAGLIYEALFGYRDTIFGEGEDAKRLAQEVLSRVFRYLAIPRVIVIALSPRMKKASAVCSVVLIWRRDTLPKGRYPEWPATG